ncbi:MAG: 4-hydroxythreonine-4-phosphate dehydrogenase [Epsilonproteobacteria bacterium]|nr:4-hydroxythreonine-4-phosphate dehydrogenase [Campylobacterota bacterium]
MKKIAISIGDLNGIGLEIALKAHKKISKICKPIYCINRLILEWGSAMLGIDIPKEFKIQECGEVFDIKPGENTKEAGESSFDSFITAVALAKSKKVSAIVTLPINKSSWAMAGINYKGHTDALSDLLGCETTMMLGCKDMFVILFTHHIPLKDVSSQISTKKLSKFLIDISKYIDSDKIAVLGLNPHAGDDGVIGSEDKDIQKAIKKANKSIKRDIFQGPLVPDTAFSKENRKEFKYFVCMYHDQGLIPLKALYFDESINVTLNDSIVRTSVDHGTAFDKAYKNSNLSLKSYINAVKEALNH